MYSIGKINQKIYKCITEDIITEEVIIIDNQIQHIKDRHPEAYNKVLKNIQEAISTRIILLGISMHIRDWLLKEYKRKKDFYRLY